MARLFSTVLIAGVLDILAQQSRYTVSGVVRDTRRQPVRDARVEVLAPGFEGRFVLTDRDGRYRITDLSGGVQLQASKEGYSTSVRAVATRTDAVVDFLLQPLRDQ
jgi:hypothetical protein